MYDIAANSNINRQDEGPRVRSTTSSGKVSSLLQSAYVSTTIHSSHRSNSSSNSTSRAHPTSAMPRSHSLSASGAAADLIGRHRAVSQATAAAAGSPRATAHAISSQPAALLDHCLAGPGTAGQAASSSRAGEQPAGAVASGLSRSSSCSAMSGSALAIGAASHRDSRSVRPNAAAAPQLFMSTSGFGMAAAFGGSSSSSTVPGRARVLCGGVHQLKTDAGRCSSTRDGTLSSSRSSSRSCSPSGCGGSASGTQAVSNSGGSSSSTCASGSRSSLSSLANPACAVQHQQQQQQQHGRQWQDFALLPSCNPATVSGASAASPFKQPGKASRVASLRQSAGTGNTCGSTGGSRGSSSGGSSSSSSGFAAGRSPTDASYLARLSQRRHSTAAAAAAAAAATSSGAAGTVLPNMTPLHSNISSACSADGSLSAAKHAAIQRLKFQRSHSAGQGLEGLAPAAAAAASGLARTLSGLTDRGNSSSSSSGGGGGGDFGGGGGLAMSGAGKLYQQPQHPQQQQQQALPAAATAAGQVCCSPVTSPEPEQACQQVARPTDRPEADRRGVAESAVAAAAAKLGLAGGRSSSSTDSVHRLLQMQQQQLQGGLLVRLADPKAAEAEGAGQAAARGLPGSSGNDESDWGSTSSSSRGSSADGSVFRAVAGEASGSKVPGSAAGVVHRNSKVLQGAAGEDRDQASSGRAAHAAPRSCTDGGGGLTAATSRLLSIAAAAVHVDRTAASGRAAGTAPLTAGMARMQQQQLQRPAVLVNGPLPVCTAAAMADASVDTSSRGGRLASSSSSGGSSASSSRDISRGGADAFTMRSTGGGGSSSSSNNCLSATCLQQLGDLPRPLVSVSSTGSARFHSAAGSSAASTPFASCSGSSDECNLLGGSCASAAAAAAGDRDVCCQQDVSAPTAAAAADGDLGDHAHHPSAYHSSNAARSQYHSRTGSGAGGSSSAGSGSSSAGGGSSSGRQQPQQQQQHLSRLHRVSSGGSTAANRQPSFLIGTLTAGDQGDVDRAGAVSDVELAVSAVAGRRGAALETEDCQEPGLLHQSSGLDAAAQLQFLTADLAASRDSSFTISAAAAGATGSSRSLPAAADGLRQCQQQQRQRQRQQPIGYTQQSGESDSDVSELSTSLERAYSSDSDSSDGDSSSISPSAFAGCSGAQAAAQRQLLHRRSRGLLGSSSSICTHDRSSSCGSGQDLDVVCGSGSGSGSTPSSIAALTVGRLAVVPRRPSGQGPPAGCVGLSNLGNTCFMNSILQCLNCLPELVAALVAGPTSSGSVPEGTGGSSRQQLAAAGMLQCLPKRSSHWNAKASVGPAFCDLLQQMWGCARSPQPTGFFSPARRAAAAGGGGAAAVLSPRCLLRALAAADERWGEGNQQDSQEFLHSLLELLQTEGNRVPGKPRYRELSSKGSEASQAAEAAAYARSWHDSLVDDLFGGQLQSTVTCSSCGQRSHQFDPMLDLSVPLPKSSKYRPVSLQDCLSVFVEEELLAGSEQVKCSSCGRTCNARKRLQVFTYPHLLVLTLKRFNSSSSGFGGAGSSWLGFSPYSKNETPVVLDAQAVLDLTPYCNPAGLQAAAARGMGPPLYQLLAVSEHSGCLGGGHYTAQGRSVMDGCWYSFNDSCVLPESCPAGDSSSAAYVLFFRLLSAV